MSKHKHRIVEIEWEDSSGYGSGAWQDKHRSLRPSIIHSIGYIHRRNKRSIELAPHVSPYNTCGNMCIPRSAIRRIRKVK